MRVIHVVSLCSRDGAYGGPFRVALNQVRALNRRGVDATIVAGTVEGRDESCLVMEGVEVRTFRASAAPFFPGFSGLRSGPLVRWLRNNVTSNDVVHVHASRDLLTSAAARTASWCGAKVVAQCHGMIVRDARWFVRLADLAYVRRSYRAVSRYIALTPTEVEEIVEVLGPHRCLVSVIGNGVDFVRGEMPFLARSSGEAALEVLFCARLHARKRPAVFVEIARDLAYRFDVRFTLVGPDGGALEEVLELLAEGEANDRIVYEGPLPYDSVMERLARADIYVLPSINEPFPMSVLEALAVGIPCVITNSTGLSAALAEAEAAVVTDGTAREMSAAVEALIGSADRRRQLGAKGRDLVREKYSMEAVAETLIREVYL